MEGPRDDPRQQLAQALERYRDRVEVAPLADLVLDSARQNPKRPAYVKVAVPDEVVKGLRGPRDRTDLLLLVRVPREVLERASSRIVLPGEV